VLLVAICGCPIVWLIMAGMEATFDVMWPQSPRGVQRRRRAERLDGLSGKRIAFLWDYLFRGDELFPILRRELTERYPTVEIIDYTVFGNLHGGDERERVAQLGDQLRGLGADAVVSGMGC
jgi:hypothetical protein